MIPDEVQNFVGDVQGFDPADVNVDPSFVDLSSDDLRPTGDSPLVGAGSPLQAELEAAWLPVYVYVPHQEAAPRGDASAPTIGAQLP
jgi:hypothetical protein